MAGMVKLTRLLWSQPSLPRTPPRRQGLAARDPAQASGANKRMLRQGQSLEASALLTSPYPGVA